jgi:hypothetical protein
VASKAVIERAAKRFAFTPARQRELADKLFASKRRVYRRTLLETARSLGYDPKRPDLSDAITDALRREADDHAARIARTFNDDLAAAAIRIGATTPDDQLADRLQTWVNARQRKRAKATAITETYPAHADAIIGLFRDLGMEPTFDFGGHPELGDAPPACEICVALERGNPWPLEAVAAIGNPHPACRQDWHVHDLDQRSLPPEFEVEFGQTLGGIVGGTPLVMRHGNDREKAVAQIEALAER